MVKSSSRKKVSKLSAWECRQFASEAEEYKFLLNTMNLDLRALNVKPKQIRRRKKKKGDIKVEKHDTCSSGNKLQDDYKDFKPDSNTQNFKLNLHSFSEGKNTTSNICYNSPNEKLSRAITPHHSSKKSVKFILSNLENSTPNQSPKIEKNSDFKEISE